MVRIKSIYSKHALHSFRILSIFCAIVLIIRSFFRFFYEYPQMGNTIFVLEYLTNIINFITIIMFILLAIFPQRFGFTSIIAFMYAILIILFDHKNLIGIIMYALGIASLAARGLLKKNTKPKLYFFIVLLLGLILSTLRFGLKEFFSNSISSLGCITTLITFTFFIRCYYRGSLPIDDKKLYLSSYPKLTERDCKILKKVQQGIKYSAIAKEFNLTEGALKNRLHFVFNTLEVGDRQGFLSIYEDYELIWSLEDVDKTEETTGS